MRRLIAASILVLSAATCLASEDQRVVKPIIEVGDRWTYRGTNVLGPGVEEYDIEVAAVRDGRIHVVCTRKRDKREFDGLLTDEWSMLSSCTGFIMRPGARFLPFPMGVGDEHPLAFTSQRVRASDAPLKSEGRLVVKAWETIDLPAGRFRCLRIEAEMQVTFPDGTTQQRMNTYWYSPEARRPVKYRSEPRGRGDVFEEEMLSFKLKD